MGGMDDAVRDVTLLPSDDVALALGVDPTMGLGPAEVVARWKAEFGA